MLGWLELAALAADCPAEPAPLLAAARASGAIADLREACRCGAADGCFELLVHADRADDDRVLAANTLAACPKCATLASGDGLDAVERDCLAGQAARCGEASVRWRDGQGVVKDAGRAHTYARMGCVGGYWYSCNDLTVLYRDPLGEQVSLAKFLAGCEQGHAHECYQAGARLGIGLGGLPKDEARSQALMTRACDGGYGTACYDRAFPLLYSQPPDVDGWLREMSRACAGGSPDGCSALAVSVKKLESTCKQGVSAYCELATRRRDGRWPAVP